MGKAQLLTVPQIYKFMMTYDLAASAPANTLFNFGIYVNGNNGSPVNPAVVPSNEKWYILNFEVSSAVTPDFLFGLIVNGTNQGVNLDANTTVPTNGARVELSSAVNGYADSIEVPPSANIQVTGYTLTANGTSAVVYTAFMKVLRVPL